MGSKVNSAILLCAVIGMVWGQSQSAVQTFKVKDNQLCQDCRAFIQDMDVMFFGPGMEEGIMERMEKLCARMPVKVASFCDDVLTDWIDNAFKLVDKLADPDVICNTLPFCGDDGEYIVQEHSLQSQEDAGPVCTMCEEMFGQVTSFVTDRRLQADIEDLAKTFFCEALPTPLNGACKDEVGSVLELLFRVVDTGLAPGTLCAGLGMCQGPGELKKVMLRKVLNHAKHSANMVHKYSYLLHHVTDQDWAPVLSSALNVIMNKKTKINTEDDGPMCAMCEGLMDDIKALATSEDFKTDIEQFTEGITCEFLPTPFNGMCKDEIDRLVDIFFDLARTQLASGNICKIVGMCGPEDRLWQTVSSCVKGSKVESVVHQVAHHVTSQNWAPVLGHFQAVLKKLFVQENDLVDATESPQCTLCKSVLGEFESIFTNPAIKKDVENLSETLLCALLPGDLKKMCLNEVDRFADLFFDFLGISMNATNVCEMTGICWDDNLLKHSMSSRPVYSQSPKDESADTHQDPVHADVNESPQCTLCKEAINQFDHVMINTALKEDVEFVTEAAMCTLLPSKLRARCKKSVEKFTDVIFDMISLGFNATNICEIVGICWGPNSMKQSLSQRVVPAIQTLTKVLAPMAPLVHKISENKNTPVVEHVTSFIVEKYPHLQDKFGNLNDAACNVCRRVMDLFKTLMDDNQFKGDIEEMAVEIMCPLLPKTFQGVCKMEINQIISTFFDILDTEMDVTIMCDFLGMCQDDNSNLHFTINDVFSTCIDTLTEVAETALPALKKFEQIKTEQGDCALCEVMMGQLFGLLRNDNSRGKMIAVGVRYCDMLTEPMSSHCKMFVGQNTASFVNSVLSKLTPKMVCKSASMCNARVKRSAETQQFDYKGLLSLLGAAQKVKTNQPKPKTEDAIMKVRREHRAPWCDICEEVSSTVNAFIGSQELLRVAISVGDSVCMLMPTGLKYPCDTFVRTFFDEFLGDVSSFMTPDFVCGVIGVCYIEFTPMNYTNSEYLHPTFHHLP